MEITTPRGTLKGKNIEAILRKYGRDCLQGADLQGADLSYAKLNYANLSCAKLNYANLSCAKLSEADLYHANLSYANLGRARLSFANLGRASLRHAILRLADLSCANLSCADLTNANLIHALLYCTGLRRADLSGADMTGADLYDASLCYALLHDANMTGANLNCADLTNADLTGATHLELTIAKTSILPDEGDIIGWKKAAADYGKPIIVKLLIPADAQRSNSTGRKCRASKARILDLQDLDGDSLPPDTTARSQHDRRFAYQKGETVHAEDFDTNRWNECAPGIHFFITRREAVEY